MVWTSARVTTSELIRGVLGFVVKRSKNTNDRPRQTCIE